MSFLSKKVPPKKDGLLSGKKSDADLDALFGSDDAPAPSAPKKAEQDPRRLIPVIETGDPLPDTPFAVGTGVKRVVVNEVRPDGVYLTPTAILAVVFAKGRVDLKVEGLQ